MIAAERTRKLTRLHCLSARRGADVRLAPADKVLQPLLKRTSGEENLVVAPVAAKPDVGTETHDRPLERAARVRLAKTHHITEEELERPVTHRSVPKVLYHNVLRRGVYGVDQSVERRESSHGFVAQPWDPPTRSVQ